MCHRRIGLTTRRWGPGERSTYLHLSIDHRMPIPLRRGEGGVSGPACPCGKRSVPQERLGSEHNRCMRHNVEVIPHRARTTNKAARGAAVTVLSSIGVAILVGCEGGSSVADAVWTGAPSLLRERRSRRRGRPPCGSRRA